MDQPKKIHHESKRCRIEGGADGPARRAVNDGAVLHPKKTKQSLFEDDECSDIATMLLALTTATQSIRSALDVLQKGPIRADTFLQKDIVDAKVKNNFYELSDG